MQSVRVLFKLVADSELIWILKVVKLLGKYVLASLMNIESKKGRCHGSLCGVRVF